MKPAYFVLLTALGSAVILLILAGRSIGAFAAFGLGLLGGGLVGAAQYAVWGGRWRDEGRAWTAGSSEQRRKKVRQARRQMLRGALATGAVAVLIFVGLWLADGRAPRVQAVVLFLPAILLLLAYVHGTWYEHRLNKQ